MLDPVNTGSPHALSDCLTRASVLFDTLAKGEAELTLEGYAELADAVAHCARLARHIELWRLQQIEVMRALQIRHGEMLAQINALQGTPPGNVLAFTPRRKALPPQALYEGDSA